MHDRIYELLGWDEETQHAVSQLSMGDFSILSYAANPNEKEGEEENEDVPYREPREFTCVTGEGSPNHRLYAILTRKGWMVDRSDDVGEHFKTPGTKHFSWTQKGFRLVPQLLIKCSIEGNVPEGIVSGAAPPS